MTPPGRTARPAPVPRGRGPRRAHLASPRCAESRWTRLRSRPTSASPRSFTTSSPSRSLDDLLDLIFDAVSDLVPCDTLTVYRTDEARRLLVPVMARDRWAAEIMESPLAYGEGITGWAVERREAILVNDAHLDPRLTSSPGRPRTSRSR